MISTPTSSELVACTNGWVDGVPVKKAICEAIVHLRIDRADIGIEVFTETGVCHEEDDVEDAEPF